MKDSTSTIEIILLKRLDYLATSKIFTDTIFRIIFFLMPITFTFFDTRISNISKNYIETSSILVTIIIYILSPFFIFQIWTQLDIRQSREANHVESLLLGPDGMDIYVESNYQRDKYLLSDLRRPYLSEKLIWVYIALLIGFTKSIPYILPLFLSSISK